MEAVAQVGVCFWFMCYVPLVSGRRRYFTMVLPAFECIQHEKHPLHIMVSYHDNSIEGSAV